MSAAVKATGDRLQVAAPRPLFTLRPRPWARLDAYAYDVAPDGSRFVVYTLIEDADRDHAGAQLEGGAGGTVSGARAALAASLDP